MAEKKEGKYLKLLNSPKWKMKALKILRRDHFKCTVCGGKNNLQVHHTFYFDNFPNPWDYPDSSLITVCDDCHKGYHQYHELTVKHFVKRKRKHKKAKQKQAQVRIPERQLIKIPKKGGYIYELKTIWFK